MEATINRLRWNVDPLTNVYLMSLFRPLLQDLYQLNCRDSVQHWVDLNCPDLKINLIFKQRDHIDNIRNQPLWLIFHRLNSLIPNHSKLTPLDVQSIIAGDQCLSKVFNITSDINILEVEPEESISAV